MAEEPLVRFISGMELPGRLRKRLVVPDGYVGLLVEGPELAGQRAAGSHSLWSWPRPAPDVVLMPLFPFDLRPRIQHLRSGDGQRLDLVWPLTVQVEAPPRFYADWLAQAPRPAAALADLEDYLAGRLWELAQGQVGQYALADLQGEGQLHSSVARALRPVLGTALAGLGLALVGSQLPQPRTFEDERDSLLETSLAARAARDARFEALFDRLEDRAMLEHRLREWAAERGAPPPGDALVEVLWQAVDGGPEEASLRADLAARALQRQVDALQATLQAERTENERRFHQFTVRLEQAEAARADVEALHKAEARAQAVQAADPVRVLKKLLTVLRIVGSALTVITTLLAIYVPNWDERFAELRLLALIVPAAVAVLTFVSDLTIRRRVRRVLGEVEARRWAESRAGLNQRRRADVAVRARIEAGLVQVADNLDAAWKEGFGQGGAARELAVHLRDQANKARQLGERDVRAANYAAGKYLGQDHVPEQELAAVLDLDQDLLERSTRLARAAESVYEQVSAGQVEAARAGLQELKVGLNALRNRFTERGAYLMRPA